MASSVMAKLPEYVQGQGFVAEVKRIDRRKTADIRIEDGSVSVVVPKNLELARIQNLLKDKRKWIKEKIQLHQESNPITNKKFVSGEAFSYLGKNYRLKVIKSPYQPVKLVRGYLEVCVPEGSAKPHVVRNALIRWYKHHAEVKLAEKVDRYAPLVGVKPAGVGVKSFKSRWGSCTAKGKLEFNWQVLMAPNRIVEYVVIHELCYLIRHDHSPEFWREVERMLPDYLKHREWLRNNAGLLQV
ncbi:M48 family metallopeptidase [Simiduia sp. 21SJ11W-1]|uniref:M48 family metallopeptidase n=1 Tax=Simiduia sp. 21SJ11W-1 TaxID=2909669 RepID=UPI00209F949A|nr:SprT family zinc-dependent metalloprotease [Simiduia sp. 21SJ11W-1]UTA47654.1 M48 family metallopeptidase [Simiduia sp. 21SJ11W-1]